MHQHMRRNYLKRYLLSHNLLTPPPHLQRMHVQSVYLVHSAGGAGVVAHNQSEQYHVCSGHQEYLPSKCSHNCSGSRTICTTTCDPYDKHEFWAYVFLRGLKPWRRRAEKFAGRIREKFARNCPKIRKTKKNQFTPAEPHDQDVGCSKSEPLCERSLANLANVGGDLVNFGGIFANVG